jgi:hypothetical protein
MSAPKPPNFAEMADAWNDPEAFAAQVNAYYALLRADDCIDITEPRRKAEA